MFKSSKRLIAMLICLAMVLSMLPMSVFADGTPSTLYLTPNANWNIGGARFAAYFFGNGETWVSMTDSNGDGVYEVEVPAGYPNVIFCRMNPNAAKNNWNNKWNQTADLTVPTDGTNWYTVMEGTWDEGGGSWSTFSTDCSHVYDDGTVTTAATCTTAGEKTYTCTLCEATKTDSIPATGHTFVDGVCSCGTTSVVIYFDNTGNWENVYVHYWGGGYGTSWPGDAMTLVEGSIYACDVPSDTTSIIFHNNSGTQTDDLTIPTDGKNLYTYNTVWSVYGEAPCAHTNVTAVDGVDATCTTAGKTKGEVCGDCGFVIVAQEEIAALGHTTAVEGETCERCGLVMDYITVYFENNWMFQDLTAYWWGSSFGTNPEWPGVAPEEYVITDAGMVVYAIEVPSDAAGLLFAGKDNDYGNDRKTPDIKFEAGKVYYMNWDEANGEHVLSYDVSVFEPACEHEYEYACSKNCKLCGEETRPEADHTYFYACDAYCVECGEKTNESAAHDVIHVEAKAGTDCQTWDGNVEYWYCSYCSTCWSDEACRMQTNFMRIKANGAHNYEAVVTEATEHTAGYTTYTCSVCGDSYTDDEVAALHSVEYVAAVVPANCQETGHDEYWYCADCDAYFGNAELTAQLNPAWIYYTGDHVRPEGSIACAVVKCEVCGEDSYGEPCDRGEAPICQDAPCVNCGEIVYGQGCNYNTGDEEVPLPLCQPGTCVYCGTEYEKLYECENGSYAPCSVDGECVYGCGKTYPATGEHEVDDPCMGGICWICWEEIAPVHNVIHVEAKAATCYENGNIEYWYCDICGQAWLDADCTLNTNLKAVVLPMAHGNIVAVEAKAATCYENGNIAHWYCEDCGQAWLDAECTLNTNLKAVVLPMAHAEATHVEAKAATCTENGNIEYWYCEACGQAWLDADCTLNTNLKSVIVPSAGHNFENGSCECGATKYDIKAQKKIDAENGNMIRLITAVDGLENYAGVTFTISTANGSKSIVVTKGFTSLIANGQTKTASDLFGEDATHLVMLNLPNLPVEGEITVEATWTTVDGDVYSTSRIIDLAEVFG